MMPSGQGGRQDTVRADDAFGPGIYVHIPFCARKCFYCAFVSQPYDPDLARAYVQALHRQIADLARHPWLAKQVFASLYVGGGTPTILDGSDLAGIIEACLRRFAFVPQPEVTVEANPNSVTVKKIQGLVAAGVNRLSIGIQSFSDRLLQMLGRPHTGDDGLRAMALARQAGVTNVSLDLMYGLPGQDDKTWSRTLATAMSLAPEHVSLYELMVEEGTPLWGLVHQNGLRLPEEGTVLGMAAEAIAKLSSHGLERYEIANFARPSRQCRHNLNYWRNGSYVGLGSAAVSCFSGFRVKNCTAIEPYIRSVAADAMPWSEGECLCRERRFRETMVIGLRMLAGVSLAALKQRFDLDPLVYYGETLKGLMRESFVIVEDDRLRLTSAGLPVADRILSQLV